MNPRALSESEVRILFGDYPYKPNSLYMIGTTSWGWPIAIVGTRKPSPNAASLTRRLVRELVRNGFKPLITGGAPGIDTIATQEALGLGAKPVIVRPCFDDTARQWALRGAVVIMESVECPVGGFKSALALRNRVIAGLARAIIIPEARACRPHHQHDKPCCGSWYTAVRFGVRVGRSVFVFKPLVGDVEVHEAFEEFVGSGVVPVGSIDELLARLRETGLV